MASCPRPHRRLHSLSRRTRSRSRTAPSTALGAAARRAEGSGPTVRGVQSDGVAAPRRTGGERHARRGTDSHPRRRTVQTARDGRPRLRRTGEGRGGSRLDPRHVRRRRHRRHGRVRSLHLSAGPPAGPHPDDTSRAGGQRRRRQGRRQSSARQESHRIVLSAARRDRRSVGAAARFRGASSGQASTRW